MIYLPLSHSSIKHLIKEILRGIENTDDLLRMANEASDAWFALFSLWKVITSAELEFRSGLESIPQNARTEAHYEYLRIRQAIEEAIKYVEGIQQQVMHNRKGRICH